MVNLIPIELEDGTIIYLEAKEDILITPKEPLATEEKKELTREDLGKGDKGLREVLRGVQLSPSEQIAQSFKLIEGTIRAYTQSTLNAFKQVADANVDKVTLEFGFKVGGKAGIPYVTEGSADSHLKITVECLFSDNNQAEKGKITTTD